MPTPPTAQHPSRRTLLALGAGMLAAPTLLSGMQPAKAMTSISFSGWQSWTFRGIPPTSFASSGSPLNINAQQSSSVVYGVVPTSGRAASSASWQWQVRQTVGPTNLTARGGDDRAIALYFVFVDADTAARFGDTTPSMSRLLGMRGGRTLIYVWGGSAARGAVLDSPYLRCAGVAKQWCCEAPVRVDGPMKRSTWQPITSARLGSPKTRSLLLAYHQTPMTPAQST